MSPVFRSMGSVVDGGRCRMLNVVRRRVGFNQSRPISALIMGAPGSGKGTISNKIVEDFPFNHISTGDLLRSEIRDGTEVGRAAKSFMDKGELVPDDVMVKVLLGAIQRAEVGRHALLDGFPRSKSQTLALEGHLAIDVVMNLDVPRQTIIDRLTDRWIHPASGRVYAYQYRPPKVEGKDDATGEDLVRRDDDKPEVVEMRLSKYEKMTRPLLDHYGSLGLLCNFKGDRSDVIYEDVKAFLKDTLP